MTKIEGEYRTNSIKIRGAVGIESGNEDKNRTRQKERERKLNTWTSGFLRISQFI
jgi:hypothetical protein